jgi:hypothetical protein
VGPKKVSRFDTPASSSLRTRAQHVAVAVAHRDHGAEPQEGAIFGEVDDLVVVDVVNRLEHGEHHVW